MTAVIDTRGCDVGVAQPFLNLGNIGMVFERIGRRCGAQRVWAESLDVDAGAYCVLGQHLVHAARGDCPAGAAGVVADRLEEGRCLVGAMASRLQVQRNCAGLGRVQWHIPDLVALVVRPV